MKSIDEYKKQWKEIGKPKEDKAVDKFAKEINFGKVIEEAISEGEESFIIDIEPLSVSMLGKVCKKYKLNCTFIPLMNGSKLMYSISGWAE